MTAEEFLEHVYGPEQQGHVHAELMAQYAEDAKTHAEPWKLWQIKAGSFDWIDCKFSPAWDPICEFRHKPKTRFIHGVEIPDLRVTPKYGEYYYLASPLTSSYYSVHRFVRGSTLDFWVERGLTYQHTKEGLQAAILHAKAMLGIV